jgi:hypothetical protein
MAFSDSRYVGLFDVPDPKFINARFVYNFFVPNERTDASGKTRFQGSVTEQTQREISTRTLEALLPRYIDIEFDETHAGFDNILDLQEQEFLSENREFIQTEETITTARDAMIKFQDLSLRNRLKGKTKVLATILGMDDVIWTSIYAALQPDQLGDGAQDIMGAALERLLADDVDGISFVNVVGDVPESPVFSAAAGLSINMMADRRLLKAQMAGNYTREGTVKTQLYQMAENDALRFLPVTSDDSGDRSDSPTLEVISSEEVDKDSDELLVTTVGYIIERRETKTDGSQGAPVKYFLDGVSNTRFLDTKVLYGSTYKYTLRAVALVKMTIESNGEENLDPGFYEVLALIASRPSPTQVVQAIERIAPQEPDGVFYRFNYDDGRGLFIRWQIPVGKQRDVKYFQIFRRKTIHDPFTCIAELDFDNSTIRSPKSERVNISRVIKLPAPETTFLDPEFNRASSFIYAVVAVDAHGYSSGYSAQSLVSFSKTTNQIELKNISRPGAPKQYPNFFIDPDLDDNISVDSLTQDSMQSSKKFSIKIYFDPDAIQYSSANGADEPLLATQDSRGLYKLHLLNIDRQKASVLELRIDDLRQIKK